MQPDRAHEEGRLRQVEMKTDPECVDGRLDQVTRNRLNMFEAEGAPIPDPTQTANRPLIRATRHAFTPYSYSTHWITHPPADSSLAPLPSEAYQTSFLATPFTAIDHEQSASHIRSKYDALRANGAAFRAKVKALNIGAQIGRERMLQNLRDQEAAYVDALKVRERIENPYRFG
jgi:hypothetical protein